MPLFSANLGFLWTNLPLPDAIRTAASAGFDAVEFHWPYAYDQANIREVLGETKLPVMGLNTRPGERFGLSAIPDKQAEAKAAILQACEWANALGASAIHVMAGRSRGPESLSVFQDNLRFACESTDRTVLIEPINTHDIPGYFLDNFGLATDIIDRLALPNLKLMFDCYHAAKMGEDASAKLRQLLPIIGHVQIASYPDRTEPQDCSPIFKTLDDLGWSKPLGAEYKPVGDIDAGLDWLKKAKHQ